jgi:hypothetical protein
MDDFIIDKDTKIYNIKVINCIVFISQDLYNLYGCNKHDELYSYILIIVNDIIKVCLPVPGRSENYIYKKEIMKELTLLQGVKKTPPEPTKATERPGCIYYCTYSCGEIIKNNTQKLELNYNVELLEKILGIEHHKFNHLQLIEYLEKEKYIDTNKSVRNNMIYPLLIQKLINYYNYGKIYVNIIEKRHHYSKPYDSNDRCRPLDKEISFYDIKLFTKLQMKKNNYKIFTNTDELMMDLTEIGKNKKYKVLKFGYKLRSDINEFSILEEIDDDIEKFINSSLIDLDEKKDSNLINLDEIEAINLDEKTP